MLDIKKLKERREALGYSQEEAAERAGIGGGRQGWSNIESGKKDVVTATLDKLAKALRCKPADLLR
jgi:transcriptional regulator with XRE-family HTH domain